MHPLLNPIGAGCAADGSGMTAENPLAKFVNKLLGLNLSQTNRAVRQHPEYIGELANIMANVERATVDRTIREPSEAELQFLRDFYVAAEPTVKLGNLEEIYRDIQTTQWVSEFKKNEWIKEFEEQTGGDPPPTVSSPEYWKQWACEMQTQSQPEPIYRGQSRLSRMAEHLAPPPPPRQSLVEEKYERLRQYLSELGPIPDEFRYKSKDYNTIGIDELNFDKFNEFVSSVPKQSLNELKTKMVAGIVSRNLITEKYLRNARLNDVNIPMMYEFLTLWHNISKLTSDWDTRNNMRYDLLLKYMEAQTLENQEKIFGAFYPDSRPYSGGFHWMPKGTLRFGRRRRKSR